ncbi:hypothetical protein MPTK1_6g19680 [Marchantia polymorpha subsp. ruderalis]|uniref:Uncharacterized protein n=2 Tax=Marchantia polymorpha TaxID=3197 RepID=A0AAF6BTW4_MARPO|nr:hypothetical protein MARPO_0045s0095 [Marchantia polymorpha]BBN15448.1 hypothetical protein Mp_6g19680 [Marchantia polymorpha subsp. ruderalis]|eukprot:PTQ39440.1 hypothetical protein MARPO_0045s0095 [Marchantia polymorpha]
MCTPYLVHGFDSSSIFLNHDSTKHLLDDRRRHQKIIRQHRSSPTRGIHSRVGKGTKASWALLEIGTRWLCKPWRSLVES